eukprot:2192117-Pleurochrysis_carterae.AAC.5
MRLSKSCTQACCRCSGAQFRQALFQTASVKLSHVLSKASNLRHDEQICHTYMAQKHELCRVRHAYEIHALRPPQGARCERTPLPV